jgi:hypothetical protein
MPNVLLYEFSIDLSILSNHSNVFYGFSALNTNVLSPSFILILKNITAILLKRLNSMLVFFVHDFFY